jgi:hypothetical protein
MRVLFLANLLNIFLAPCFIYGPDIFAFFNINAPQWLLDVWIFPKLGVTGAAVGTTIGRGAGVLFAAWYLIRKSGRITIRKEHWKFDSEIFSGLVKIAAPAVLQFTIATASWTALVRVVAGFGSEAIAGYVIGLRVIMFALLPAVGLSNAAATLVGQNWARASPNARKERLESGVYQRGGSWRGRFAVFIFLKSNRRIFYRRIGRSGLRHELSAHCRIRFCVLRFRDGFGIVVQRRGRHLDADLFESVHFLAV